MKLQEGQRYKHREDETVVVTVHIAGTTTVVYTYDNDEQGRARCMTSRSALLASFIPLEQTEEIVII